MNNTKRELNGMYIDDAGILIVDSPTVSETAKYQP
jgi:hypothetical protein